MEEFKIVNGIKTPLTEEELIELQAKRDAAALDEQLNGYKRSREKEYKDVHEYLDMIWHAIDQGLTLDTTSQFYLDRKAVKDKYPKPS